MNKILSENQEKYLQTLPEDKRVTIEPFNPNVNEIAQGILDKIHGKYPELPVLFMGASALGIAGQNDVDIYILSKPEEYEKYLSNLIKLFGEPLRNNSTAMTWAYEENGIEIELYLTDKDSPELQEQIEVFEALRNDSRLRQEYEDLKLESDGLPFREYMRRKYEFFNRIIK